MKANELMIGDWVCVHYLSKTKGEVYKPFRVEQIRNDYGELCAWSENDGNMGAIFLQPISLTPEILEKNGFEDVGQQVYQTEEKPYWIWWEADRCRLGIDIDESYEQEDFGRVLRMPITFIHELQHALRLCGIDKEIIV